MGIQANDKISKLIIKKYGEFSADTMKRYFLEEFFVGSRARKIDEQDYEAILEQIEKLASAQNLNLEDVDYLGFGQRFSCIGVGDAVIKIGNTTEKVYENPYRIAPVYKQDLKKYERFDQGTDLGLYVSQRAKTEKVPENLTQEMYNLVRDAGGLWLDIKEENLGFVDGKMDFKSIYPNQTDVNESANIDFPEYNGNLFVIDYEDMLFLTPELKQKMLNGEAPNVNYVPRELLKGDYTNDKIYFESFIKKSSKLLKYEMNYQREKGDLTAASKCFSELLKNERQIIQQRYTQEQRYRYGRNTSDIKSPYSIKEIAIQIAQKTNIKAIDRIAEFVRSKIQERRERKSADDKALVTETIDEFKSTTLTVEEIEVGEFEQEKANNNVGRDSKQNLQSTSSIDLEDPFTTR
ncbi:MAG: hypothetical protein IJW20_00460 [Clostridia bacterium]|nr:hypothetical protein [Clostridia bacterium]